MKMSMKVKKQTSGHVGASVLLALLPGTDRSRSRASPPTPGIVISSDRQGASEGAVGRAQGEMAEPEGPGSQGKV